MLVATAVIYMRQRQHWPFKSFSAIKWSNFTYALVASGTIGASPSCPVEFPTITTHLSISYKWNIRFPCNISRVFSHFSRFRRIYFHKHFLTCCRSFSVDYCVLLTPLFGISPASSKSEPITNVEITSMYNNEQLSDDVIVKILV